MRQHFSVSSGFLGKILAIYIVWIKLRMTRWTPWSIFVVWCRQPRLLLQLARILPGNERTSRLWRFDLGKMKGILGYRNKTGFMNFTSIQSPEYYLT
jgi:hypothetical protein